MLTKKLTKTLLLLITFSLTFACEKEGPSSEAPLAGEMEAAGEIAGAIAGQAAGELAGEEIPVQIMDFDTMEIDMDPDMGPDMD